MTALPHGEGGAYNMKLAGATRVPGVGILKLTGNLSSNPSLPQSNTNTQGTLFLASRAKGGGTVTMSVSGQGTNLAPAFPQTSHLSFTVTAATGRFSSALGFTGAFDLTQATKGRPRNGIARGLFSTTLSLNL